VILPIGDDLLNCQ